MEDVGDVLIVGGGPVGMLTALALAQTGASVTLIEAETDIADSPRAMVYFAPTLVALEELQLRKELEAEGVIGRQFGHHVPSLGFHETIDTACMAGITYDYQLHCGQDVVAHAALARARAIGVDVRFGHRLTALEQRADGVVAQVETAQGTRSLRTGWVIGADGARSTVRRLIDVSFDGYTWDNRFVATNVYCDLASLGYQAANFVCDPENSAVIAVIDGDGLWRLTYQEPASLPSDTFRERLPERYAAFIPEGVRYDVKSASPYSLHQRCAATLRRGRVLLAGDAAHATNPCGGLGLTTGVWTGMILADVLGAVLRGEADDAILDRYSDERRRIFLEVSSPGATANKRMLEEADPEQRRRDLEPVRAMAADPAIARMMLSFPFKVIGDVLRPESRWRHADPLAAHAIDLALRRSQLA